MCQYCDNIGYPNTSFSLYCDHDDDNWEELQIVRSHEWKDHGYLVLGGRSWSDPIKAVSNRYSKKNKILPILRSMGRWRIRKMLKEHA